MTRNKNNKKSKREKRASKGEEGGGSQTPRNGKEDASSSGRSPTEAKTSKNSPTDNEASGMSSTETKASEAPGKAPTETKTSEAPRKERTETETFEAPGKAKTETETSEASGKAKSETETSEAPGKAPTETETSEAPVKVPTETEPSEASGKAPAETETLEAPGKAQTETETSEAPGKAPTETEAPEAPRKDPTEAETSEAPRKAPTEAETAEAPRKAPTETETAEEPEKAPAETETSEAPRKAPTEAETLEEPRKDPTETETLETPGKSPTETETSETPGKSPTETETSETPGKAPTETETSEAPRKAPTEAETLEEPGKSSTETETSGTSPTETVHSGLTSTEAETLGNSPNEDKTSETSVTETETLGNSPNEDKTSETSVTETETSPTYIKSTARTKEMKQQAIKMEEEQKRKREREEDLEREINKKKRIWEEKFEREKRDWERKSAKQVAMITELRDKVSKLERKKATAEEDLSAVQESLVEEERQHQVTIFEKGSKVSEANRGKIAAVKRLAEAKEETRRAIKERKRCTTLQSYAEARLNEYKGKIARLEKERTEREATILRLQTSLRSRSASDNELENVKEYALLRFTWAKDKEAVVYLIRKGVDVCIKQQYDGRTPLHIAASLDCRDIARELIDARADVYSRDSYGDMPLHVAAREGSEGVVELLVKRHHDLLKEKDANERTPAELATSLGQTHLLQYLAPDSKEPLLHMAAASGQEETYLWLLHTGWPLEDRNRRPAFKYAEVAGFFTLASRLWLARRGWCGTWAYNILGWRPLSWVLYLLFSWQWASPKKDVVDRLQVQNDLRRKTSDEEAGGANRSDRGSIIAEDSISYQDETKPIGKKLEPEPKIQDPVPSKEITPVGLPNISNTCYMNSVLQCLFHTLPLTKFFRDKNTELAKYINRESEYRGEAARAYSHLIQGMVARKGDLRNEARGMKEMSGRFDSYLADYGQKEPHDFLASLLEFLHNDLAKETPGVDEFHLTSVVEELFHIKHLETITCETHNFPIIVRVESLSNMSLALASAQTTPLEDLLKNYYEPKYVKWPCDMCSKTHMCRRETNILHLPPFLIIHLSRYNAQNPNGGKVGVTFPENLEKMNAYCSYETDRRYSVYGLCFHSGTMNFGHCVALCRSSGEAGEEIGQAPWHFLNDSIVTPRKDCNNLRQTDVHILFYKAVC